MALYSEEIRSPYGLERVFRERGHEYPNPVYGALFEYLWDMSESIGEPIDVDEIAFSNSVIELTFDTNAELEEFEAQTKLGLTTVEHVLYVDSPNRTIYYIEYL